MFQLLCHHNIEPVTSNLKDIQLQYHSENLSIKNIVNIHITQNMHTIGKLNAGSRSKLKENSLVCANFW